MSSQDQLLISVSWRCEINILFVCLFTLYWVSPCFVPNVTCTTNKRIIVIPWAVKAVTVGKAPPFPYSPLHRSGLDVYNGFIGVKKNSTHSAHRADSVSKSQCPSVCLSVCLCHFFVVVIFFYVLLLPFANVKSKIYQLKQYSVRNSRNFFVLCHS